MTIDLSIDLEMALRHLALLRGEKLDRLVEEAIQQYLDRASISDISAADVGATQEARLPELGKVPDRLLL